MASQETRSGGKGLVAGIMAVAATYVYFLIFAQFGFLRTVQAAGADAGTIRMIMAVMGLAGIAGSGAAAFFHSERRARGQLAGGFVTCAVAAGGSQLVATTTGLVGIAGLVGLGTGFTTVTLAALLHRAVEGRFLGRVIGLGTGVAYGFCNLPAVFASAPGGQAMIALLVAGAGVGVAWQLDLAERGPARRDFDRDPAGVAVWTFIFMLLVGLDAAAFAIIQQTPALKGGTWTGATQLGWNAAAHLVAAGLAGWALDRGGLGRAVFAGAALLLAACGLLGGTWATGGAVALLYTTGVSVYSTMLAYYPARDGRPAVAAVVYSVAGWVGSALGIGAAQDRHELPDGMVGAVAAALGLALAARFFWRRQRSGKLP